ncbi:MAG: hypothetical protein ABI859_17475 [Pseudomonadota bacterium]
MINPSENVEEEDGEELDDYEVGFLDGYFAARGIEQPTDADFTEAFATLARMVESHDDEH